MRYLIFLCFFVIATAGCVPLSHPILPQTDISTLPRDGAIVIVGCEIAEKGKEFTTKRGDTLKSDLDAMLLGFYVNGQRMPAKGLVIKGAYEDKVPLIIANQWAEPEYIEANEKNHGYLIWHIPASAIKDEAKTIAFITSIRSERKVWGRFHRDLGLGPTLLAPVNYGNSPLEQSDGWTYTGVNFTIKKPGIYYFGEFYVVGQIKTAVNSYLNASVGHYSDKKRLMSFLAENKIDPALVYDASLFGDTKMQGAYFLDRVNGR